MNASSHFNTSIDMAQKRIDSAIAAKLTDFFGMAEYDWTPRQEQSQPSDYLPEMLQWLETMMESVLIVLPADIKMEHYRKSFGFIADTLLDTYVLNRDDPVPQASLLGLGNVMVDLKYLETQAEKLQVSILSVFDELRQTLTIPIEDKVTEYAMNTTVRQAKYKSVTPAKLAAVLDKLGRYEQKVTPGDAGERQASKRRNERDAVLRLVRR